MENMTLKRIKNVLKKEWKLTFKSVNNTLVVTLLPLLIVGQVLGIIFAVKTFVGANSLEDITSNAMIQRSMANLQGMISSEITSLSLSDRFHLLLVSQFPYYLLLIPTMIAISLATFSIVEEKQTGTLEPLLATPVRTWELLLAKALSGAIPAIIMSWVCAVVFLVGITFLVSKAVVETCLQSTQLISIWLISLIFLVPAISVLSFMLGVISSSKASDAKSAQNVALIIVLPVLAIVATQIIGVISFTPILLLILSFVLCLLDLAVLRLAVKLFCREAILVRWK
jgi:ABC-2 type transport system permease protein